MNAAESIAPPSHAARQRARLLPLLVELLGKLRPSEVLVLCALPGVKHDDIALRVKVSPACVRMALKGLCAAGFAIAREDGAGTSYDITPEGEAVIETALRDAVQQAKETR